MSKKALALRAIGEDLTAEEMDEVRDAAEEGLGEDYVVLVVARPIEVMDAETAIREMEHMVDRLKAGEA